MERQAEAIYVALCRTWQRVCLVSETSAMRSVQRFEEEHDDMAIVLKGQSNSCAENNLGVEWRKKERIDEDKSEGC